ncbi:MAG: hypothetical protein KatS3mg085_746 [Candidatus Dojkabacteria bacterium]|nr:MAG: hypothetical protein KatS3mg085_746 [Candidatus Dojkabacteria bacterium]
MSEILIIEDRIPYPFLGAGYPRASNILHVISNILGKTVTFYALKPDEYPEYYERFVNKYPNVRFLRADDKSKERLGDFLRRESSAFKKIIVSRAHNMRRVGELIENGLNINIPIIFDTEAIGSLRTIAKMELEHPVALKERIRIIREEMKYAKHANSVWVVSEHERQILVNSQIVDVRIDIIGHPSLEISEKGYAFNNRKGLLFVGAMHGDDTPNSNSILWFINNVLPYLSDDISELGHLDLIGICSSKRVRELESTFVRIHGRVEDISQFYSSSRVFVAPTRYAAGLPWKVTEAISMGMPVITTSIIARQVGLTDGINAMVADTPDEFAYKLRLLYTEESIWSSIRENGVQLINRDYSQENFVERITQGLSVDFGGEITLR